MTNPGIHHSGGGQPVRAEYLPGRVSIPAVPFRERDEGRYGAGADEGRSGMRQYLLAVHMVEGEPV
ncbi:MAG TPA: hypothetical protein VF951_02730, partial [Streptosporangiaceae bacterium]